MLPASSFTLTKSDVIRMSADFVGRGLPSVTANPSGTWTRNAPDNLFHWSDLDRLTMNFAAAGDVSFHCEEVTFDLSHDIVAVGQDATNPDSFQTYLLTNRQAAARVKVVKDSDTHTMLSSHATDAELNLNVGYGNASPGTIDGDFDFECNGKITEQPTTDPSDPMMVDCPVTLLQSDDGATEGITVVMADAVDKTW